MIGVTTVKERNPVLIVILYVVMCRVSIDTSFNVQWVLRSVSVAQDTMLLKKGIL